MSSDDESIRTPRSKVKCIIVDSEDETTSSSDEDKIKKPSGKRKILYDSSDEGSSNQTETTMSLRSTRCRGHRKNSKLQKAININHLFDEDNTQKDDIEDDIEEEEADNDVEDNSDSEDTNGSVCLKRDAQHKRKKKGMEEESCSDHLEENDINDFIVSDDIVEYDSDDNNAEEDDGEDNEEDSLSQSDDPLSYLQNFCPQDQKDAFNIYLQYLATTLVDFDFPDQLQKTKNDQDSIYFLSAVDRIESILSSRRQSLISNATWNPDFSDDLHQLPLYSWIIDGDQLDCEACGRAKHPATVLITLSGKRYRSLDMYGKKWTRMFKSSKGLKGGAPERQHYRLGKHCFGRTLVYSQLLHYKYLLLKVIQQKIQTTKLSSSSTAIIQSILEDEEWMLKKINAEDIWFDVRRDFSRGKVVHELLWNVNQVIDLVELNDSDLERIEHDRNK